MVRKYDIVIVGGGPAGLLPTFLGAEDMLNTPFQPKEEEELVQTEVWFH